MRPNLLRARRILNLAVTAGAMACTAAMAQLKLPPPLQADPNAGARSATAPAPAPARPAKTLADGANPGERMQVAPPGTGMAQTRPPNQGERMIEASAGTQANKKAPRVDGVKPSRGAP